MVSNFIVQALRGELITIYGDGKLTRSFCYVDDLIDGMVRLMNSPAGFAGPVDIGNPNEFTMLDWRRRYSSSPARRPSWSSTTCPSTTPSSANQTSRSSVGSSGGSRPYSWPRGLGKTIGYFRSVLA